MQIYPILKNTSENSKTLQYLSKIVDINKLFNNIMVISHNSQIN